MRRPSNTHTTLLRIPSQMAPLLMNSIDPSAMWQRAAPPFSRAFAPERQLSGHCTCSHSLVAHFVLVDAFKQYCILRDVQKRMMLTSASKLIPAYAFIESVSTLNTHMPSSRCSRQIQRPRPFNQRFRSEEGIKDSLTTICHHDNTG